MEKPSACQKKNRQKKGKSHRPVKKKTGKKIGKAVGLSKKNQAKKPGEVIGLKESANVATKMNDLVVTFQNGFLLCVTTRETII